MRHRSSTRERTATVGSGWFAHGQSADSRAPYHATGSVPLPNQIRLRRSSQLHHRGSQQLDAKPLAQGRRVHTKRREG